MASEVAACEAEDGDFASEKWKRMSHRLGDFLGEAAGLPLLRRAAIRYAEERREAAAVRCAREDRHVQHISYQELVDQASHLSRRDQERLLEELRGLVHHQPRGPEARSILELQGLGKAVWAEVDAQEYVNRERASWDG